MKIQIFKNGKGVIHGDNAMRITCHLAGTLYIGSFEIKVSPDAESVLPLLSNGGTGVYKASFTSEAGIPYELANVTVQRGRIVPPPQNTIEMIELRSRLDTMEDECEALRQRVQELSNIFDTNSLNFLI